MALVHKFGKKELYGAGGGKEVLEKKHLENPKRADWFFQKKVTVEYLKMGI